METSIETMDPLGVNAPMQPEGVFMLTDSDFKYFQNLKTQTWTLTLIWLVFLHLFQPFSDCDGWLGTSVASPSTTSSKECGGVNVKEETSSCEHRSITETVINGSMKETVSLIVDAKTETAVFKRFDIHIHAKTYLFELTVTISANGNHWNAYVQ